jgi:hypothetical protein
VRCVGERLGRGERRERRDCVEGARALGGRKRNAGAEGPADRPDVRVVAAEQSCAVSCDALADREGVGPAGERVAEALPAGWGRRVEVVDVERRDPERRQPRCEPVVERVEPAAAVQDDHGRTPARRPAALGANRNARARIVGPRAARAEMRERVERDGGESEQQHRWRR